jgi:hypothetical protein
LVFVLILILGSLLQLTPKPHRLKPVLLLSVQLEELDWGRLFEVDIQFAGDLAQGVVEVREVIDGHVADEGAANFVVACAAMQPAQEDAELNDRGESDY